MYILQCVCESNLAVALYRYISHCLYLYASGGFYPLTLLHANRLMADVGGLVEV